MRCVLCRFQGLGFWASSTMRWPVSDQPALIHSHVVSTFALCFSFYMTVRSPSCLGVGVASRYVVVVVFLLCKEKISQAWEI